MRAAAPGVMSKGAAARAAIAGNEGKALEIKNACRKCGGKCGGSPYAGVCLRCVSAMKRSDSWR